GLPSPGAAAALVGLVLLHEDVIRVSASSFASSALSAAMPYFAFVLGLLMVSRMKYFHLVNTLLRGRRPFSQVVVMVFALLIGALIKPQLTIAALAAAYALSGPVLWVFRRDYRKHLVPAVATPPAAQHEKQTG